MEYPVPARGRLYSLGLGAFIMAVSAALGAALGGCLGLPEVSPQVSALPRSP